MTISSGIRTSLALLFLLVGAPDAFSDDLTDLVTTVEQGYRQLSDLQASFVQKTTIATIKRTETGTGELLLKRGKGAAKFRFDYQKPKQQIISDGATLWYYQPNEKQVLKTSSENYLAGGNSLAMSYLTGMGDLSRDFTPKAAGKDPQGNYLLELSPRKKSPIVHHIQLAVSADALQRFRNEGAAQVPFPLAASILFDAAGNRTEIRYDRIKVNQGISNSRFVFTVPSGVTVIQQ